MNESHMTECNEPEKWVQTYYSMQHHRVAALEFRCVAHNTSFWLSIDEVTDIVKTLRKKEITT